jgi:hypothetical protein
MPQCENSNVVRLDPVEHRIRPPGGRQHELRSYRVAGYRSRFGKLTDLHDRGLYRRQEFKAGPRLLGFEEIDGGLKFTLG